MSKLLRYFVDEMIQSQIADITLAEGKRGQEPRTPNEFVFDVCKKEAVVGNANYQQLYAKGYLDMLQGRRVHLTKAEVDLEQIESDENWRPGALSSPQMKAIKLADSSILYNGLLLAAKVQNAIHKKLVGPQVKYPCLEAFVYEIVVDAIVSQGIQAQNTELDAERKAVFTEEKKVESPAPKTNDA